MNLTLTQEHQDEMRRAHFDGAPGTIVSGFVWLVAALTCYHLGMYKAVWALLIGGALIHPLGTVVEKLLGRPSKTSKANALNPLAAASTVWLILCCALAYGLFLLRAELFFPAMMATIGSRYLVFATVFGRLIYWALGGTLIVAANLAYFSAMPPTSVAGLCGLIEVVFAVIVFSTARKLAE